MLTTCSICIICQYLRWSRALVLLPFSGCCWTRTESFQEAACPLTCCEWHCESERNLTWLSGEEITLTSHITTHTGQSERKLTWPVQRCDQHFIREMGYDWCGNQQRPVTSESWYCKSFFFCCQLVLPYSPLFQFSIFVTYYLKRVPSYSPFKSGF